ncbi:Gfo/Idh/MocA family protein [Parenemella sanctibonifatiensis]|uniref:Oxidoreductase n=1 Tax=Parenemella sanctibonifatiensis TaxID=2016505 RepID=A0A255E161_9ACTN|nr:Gfo/Idh/MocA family oxidoreductase [Parenemella sanctibonifatiensis]OYN85298.1 oxidoreductase [Parenemella sanctibonifatiensis]
MSEHKKLRAAVVGLGYAGTEHMRGYVADPDVELVAIAGHEPDRLQELSEEFGGAETYTSQEELIENADIDVLSLATPTALHAPAAIAALNRGIHVLTEKPMAETLEAATRMSEAARANDRVLQVTFNQRHQPATQAALKAVADGELGSIYLAKARWSRPWGIPGLDSWFARKSMAGGGPLMDLGIHMLDLGLLLMGEPAPVRVTAATYAAFGPRGLGGPVNSRKTAGPQGTYDVEDLGTAFVRMGNGATLLLESSWAQHIPHDEGRVELYGDEGSVVLELASGTGRPPHAALTRVCAADDITQTELPLGPGGGHKVAVAEFLAAVRAGAPDYGTVGLRRTAVIQALFDSAEAGHEVEVASPEL